VSTRTEGGEETRYEFIGDTRTCTHRDVLDGEPGFDVFEVVPTDPSKIPVTRPFFFKEILIPYFTSRYI
jgi:hypothetical protein